MASRDKVVLCVSIATDQYKTVYAETYFFKYHIIKACGCILKKYELEVEFQLFFYTDLLIHVYINYFYEEVD